MNIARNLTFDLTLDKEHAIDNEEKNSNKEYLSVETNHMDIPEVWCSFVHVNMLRIGFTNTQSCVHICILWYEAL